MDQTESLFINTTLEENGTVTECKNVEDLKQTGNNDSSETSSTEDSSSGSSSSDDSSTTESGEESTKGSASESCNIALEISLISNEGTEDIRQDNTSASKELKEKRSSSLNPHMRKEELHRNKKGRSMEHTSTGTKTSEHLTDSNDKRKWNYSEETEGNEVLVTKKVKKKIQK
ncbi:bromodomain-containing protein 4-like [Trichomycterus rosablanca]|uniref:bromodomain-containing protein 4-like n=1 Tax=Trichomycterus rosablanca TaxID=2290929 RepID=UPI002F35DCA2